MTEPESKIEVLSPIEMSKELCAYLASFDLLNTNVVPKHSVAEYVKALDIVLDSCEHGAVEIMKNNEILMAQKAALEGIKQRVSKLYNVLADLEQGVEVPVVDPDALRVALGFLLDGQPRLYSTEVQKLRRELFQATVRAGKVRGLTYVFILTSDQPAPATAEPVVDPPTAPAAIVPGNSN